MRISFVSCVAAIVLALALCGVPCDAQSTNAAVGGQITDEQGRVVPGVTVVLTNLNTGVTYEAKTNGDGFYNAPNLPPGIYRANVTKDGFKSIVKGDIELHVQDVASVNFQLQIGSVNETVTVEAGGLVINTTDATVSTVVDRQFAENLPMNGRSFQTLIQLTPGVVVAPVNLFDGGQFSVNGQRPSSNYWMVDGVSANIGVSATIVPGNGLSGSLGSFSALGGTNSLVSVDAMQEFRIQTSTYAPEFGRAPGAQISILTRSGTNQFHGTAFDYVRNDLFDANNWFNTAVNPELPKAEERQNDFGGKFGGPIIKDKEFFLFSYEGLRLRLPQTSLTTVPDASFTPGTTNSRQNAVLAMQPYLNAFPLPNPNSPEIPCNPRSPFCSSSGLSGSAALNASYSNPASLDAYSLRIDHKLSNKWTLFGRYNYSPSELAARGPTLSDVASSRITTQTATVGATWIASPVITNDLRFNYSRTNSLAITHLDNFGGAVPLASLAFPSPFTAKDSFLAVGFFALKLGNVLTAGRTQQSLQRQFNIVDGLSMQKSSHSLKFGVDYRRLSPVDNPLLYRQVAFFFNMPSAENGMPRLSQITSSVASTFLFQNLGLYAQDTWRVAPRLTLTYGLRWDVDVAPSSLSGPSLSAVTGYNLNNLSNLALAPAGTAPFNTTYGNVAPRVGAAYQLSQAQGWPTVVRGGFGVFYDLATSEFGTLVASAGYPFVAEKTNFGGTFPLDSTSAAPPAITPSNLSVPPNKLTAFDPHLKLPYTLEWNVALEQGLGSQQSISGSYVGSSGRRLLQSAYIFSPNPNFYATQLVGNTAASDYNALQLQFQRRLSHGLQALASYTWSHSIDDGSSGSPALGSNTFVPTLGPNANRGPSDFDIRNAFSAGLTYEIPVPKLNVFTKAILHGWSVENFVIAFSAPPVDITYGTFEQGAFVNSLTDVRPDLVPGQPLYLYGGQCVSVLGPPCAGGKGFNPAAFASPPVDSNTGNPLRQGNLGRNALRGLGAAQWDFAVHREFSIHEGVKLQFRGEFFNVLNHPNFSQPVGDLQDPQALNPQFGQSQFMLGQGLSGAGSLPAGGSGAFSPLYQLGGPRSIQFALKLSF